MFLRLSRQTAFSLLVFAEPMQRSGVFPGVPGDGSFSLEWK
jgi:hypothetical protein